VIGTVVETASPNADLKAMTPVFAICSVCVAERMAARVTDGRRIAVD